MRTYQGNIRLDQIPANGPTTIQAPDPGDHYRRSDVKAILRAFTGMGYARVTDYQGIAIDTTPAIVRY